MNFGYWIHFPGVGSDPPPFPFWILVLGSFHTFAKSYPTNECKEMLSEIVAFRFWRLKRGKKTANASPPYIPQPPLLAVQRACEEFFCHFFRNAFVLIPQPKSYPKCAILREIVAEMVENSQVVIHATQVNDRAHIPRSTLTILFNGAFYSQSSLWVSG